MLLPTVAGMACAISLRNERLAAGPVVAMSENLPAQFCCKRPFSENIYLNRLQ
jgi:hypothetical protein